LAHACLANGRTGVAACFRKKTTPIGVVNVRLDGRRRRSGGVIRPWTRGSQLERYRDDRENGKQQQELRDHDPVGGERDSEADKENAGCGNQQRYTNGKRNFSAHGTSYEDVRVYDEKMTRRLNNFASLILL
jgi:hypothetical protein